jgi:hypothetical protein
MIIAWANAGSAQTVELKEKNGLNDRTENRIQRSVVVGLCVLHNKCLSFKPSCNGQGARDQKKDKSKTVPTSASFSESLS